MQQMYFVKTEVIPGKVDELARKIVRDEIPSVEGNVVYVTSDGRFGYNLIEGTSEDEVRHKFDQYRDYIIIREITPILPMGQFIERWKAQRAA